MTLRTSRRGVLRGAAALMSAPAILLPSRSAFAEMSEDPIARRALVFNEPFATLDTSIWIAGPKATTFDTGLYGRSAFARASGEEGFNPYTIVNDPMASDGKALQISAKYIGKLMSVPNYYGNNSPEFQWISGNIQTAHPNGTITKGWRRGYFEARMWFPKHPLTWPAFWMMNGRSILRPQTSIELDIVEHKGWELDLYGAYLHEWGQLGEHHEGTSVPTGIDVTQGYHRYGMLVDGAQCALYFDRQPVRHPGTNRPIIWTIGRSGQMDEQGDVFWPLLTLALRSDVPFPNPLRPEDHLAHLRIDYFHVYA
jgi:beta-glucanase (GH16 family)